MQKIDSSQLTPEESALLVQAQAAAKHSISPMGHTVGAALKTSSGNFFIGASLARTRLLGSTCAERMAVDQFYFSSQKEEKPKHLAVIGFFQKPAWTDADICTPCGVCLEMLFETINDFGVTDLPIICSSWDQKNFLRTTLLELFPKPDADALRRSWSSQTS